MKISLKRTPEQDELIKAMASRNRQTAYEAQTALAEFIGPILAEVVNTAPTISNLFTQLQFNADDNPSIPLDLYYDITDEDYITVWSQSAPGGLPQNQVLPTVSEMKVTTYTLDSALSFDRRYAAKSRMDVVSKTFTRMAQEILGKQERTSTNLLMSALATATTNSLDHLVSATTAGTFLLNDFNTLITRARRINTSYNKGTPVGGASRGVTDLLISPELENAIRTMAYNPINTKGAGGSSLANDARSNGIAAPDEMRMAIYKSAGLPEFYGVSLTVLNELGKGQKYNTIFDTVYSAAGGTFDGSTQEVAVALDRGRDSLVRVTAVDGDSGSEFSLTADDQFSIRQGKIGYFGQLEEGRVCLDNRGILGVIV